MNSDSSKLQLFKLLKEKAIRLAREDSFVFTDYIFGYKSVEVHNSWHRFIDTNQSGLILACRDFGKTQHMVGRMLWEIGKNPNLRVKIVTETEDLAGKILGLMAKTIVNNERLKEVFPDLVPEGQWTKFALNIKRSEYHKDATLEGSGVMSGSTGGRADIIIFDDTCGMRNTLYLPRMREQVKESFYSNWLNILDGPKARYYVIGTPWHVDDLISDLRYNDNIPKCKEMWVGDNFESPWPERFPDEYFRKRLQLLKPRHYNRAYRGLAISDEESWINTQAVDNCIDKTVKVYDILSNKELPKFVGVDLGHREGPKACPSVVFTIARTPDGKRIPCDIKIMHESNSLEIARVIINVWKDIQPVQIYVENNNAQQYLIDTIQSLGPTGLAVKGYYTGVQKIDPRIGVPSLLAEIETGQWMIPLGAGGKHDETCKCTFCIWIDEIKNYPYGHTDTVMASWLAVENLRTVMERSNPAGNFTVWEF